MTIKKIVRTTEFYCDVRNRRPLTLEEIKSRLDRKDLIGSFPSAPLIWMGKYNFDWNKLQLIVDDTFAHVFENTIQETGDAKSSVFVRESIPEKQPHNRKELSKFLNWLFDKINYVAEQWDYPSNTSYRVFSSWFNEHYYGGVTEPHIHEMCNFVVSCYLKVPENSGNILFRDPLFETRSMEPSIEKSAWISYNIKENDILIFPGWLEHQVEPNLTNERRVVMTFNIQVDWHKMQNSL